MSEFLSAFAVRHFVERPRQSLLAGLAARIDGRNLPQALGSGCRPWQHLAWRRMVQWDDAEINLLVERALKADGTELPAVLKAVSHESLPISDALLARIAELMESPRADVRLAAARVIALRQPLAAIPLLRRGSPAVSSAERRDHGSPVTLPTGQSVSGDHPVTIDRDVWRTLCLSDDPSLVVPLMSAFGFPNQSPPPTIGFAVTPEWLGDTHARESQLVQWLIRHCGYCENGLCDAEVSREVLHLLSSGFSFVSSRMAGEPRLTKVAHRWQRRLRSFVWRLLPEELDLDRDDAKPFAVDDPLEIDLFLAAVRDSDRMLFREQKSRPPFDRAGAGRDPGPACFHASARFVRRRFVDEPLVQAEQWNIPRERQGDFLLDAARVLLEPNEEARTAADLARRGKWLMKARGSVGWALLPVRQGAQSTANDPLKEQRPEVRRAGVPILQRRVELPPLDNRLSPGADSVKNLAAVCGLDWRGIADWLANAEARWSRCVVPMGIEVQIPQVDPDRFAAWKEALPILGIPSPHRPEFGGMIEAAFRPAKTFHAMALGLPLLCRMGLIAEPQDMALHISLQGELDDRVRFLAFPHLFIHPSPRLRNRPDGSMARVMSKGFVHVHTDTVSLTETVDRPARTELRMFRLFAESHENDIELARGFVSDLVAVQVLGSAMVSPCRDCQALFGDYASAVEQSVRDLPREFGELLAANYFESTGDPREETLLKLLPIFRCWTAVREVVRAQDLTSSLDLRFRRLRHRHVLAALKHWSDDHDLNTGELTVGDEEIELLEIS